MLRALLWFYNKNYTWFNMKQRASYWNVRHVSYQWVTPFSIDLNQTSENRFRDATGLQSHTALSSFPLWLKVLTLAPNSSVCFVYAYMGEVHECFYTTEDPRIFIHVARTCVIDAKESWRMNNRYFCCLKYPRIRHCLSCNCVSYKIRIQTGEPFWGNDFVVMVD